MDVSELFKTPAPKTDPTKTGGVILTEEDNLNKRNQSYVEDDLETSNDMKKRKVSFNNNNNNNNNKGKQRAFTNQEFEIDNEDDDEEGGRFFGDGLTNQQKQIIEILNEEQEEDHNEEIQKSLSNVEIKKLCLNLERSINKNREMRTKFVDQPEKFVDSEFELSEAIVKIAVMTQDPVKSYPELARLGTLTSLVGLLSHENVDIAISVVEILQEFTDDDVLENQESEELETGGVSAPAAVQAMVQELVENQLLEMLVSTLVDRLNEKEEAERNGVFHCLGLIENLISLDPNLSIKLTKKTPLINYLMNRIKKKKSLEDQKEEEEHLERYELIGFQNKQYSSEILAIILQQDQENRKELISLGGMDVLLEVLSVYRKQDPKDADETEFMENIFDCLCSVLLEPENKLKFLEGEGVELMIIMMKQKRIAKHRALKVLDHALSGDEGSLNCERFVEHLGLKTLFPLFMGKKTNKKQISTHEDDEHILGIIVSLFFNLGSETDHRLRLLTKFVEDGYEKIDRLVEIRETFENKVQHFTNNSHFLQSEMDETDIYLMKLDAGLFALQLTDVIIGWITMEDDGMKDHLKMILKRQSKDFNLIIDELKIYYNSMGDDGFGKDGILKLIEYLKSVV